MKLLLFDVDMTLIDSGGVGRSAMLLALEDMFGAANGLSGISFAGRTDPLILREALDCYGLSWSQRIEDEFKASYLQNLATMIKTDCAGQDIKPGIESVLLTAHERADIVLALLTGNWHQGAHIKLSHFGLFDFFEFGAYSDDSYIRSELPPVAAQRFHQLKGTRIDPGDVYVIGDTPLDVECARPFGAKAVAVATGHFTTTQLQAARPDYLFSDLSDTSAFFEMLDSDGSG